MRLTRWLFSSLLLLSGSVSIYAQAPLPKVAHDYPIKPVPFTEVHLNDNFWAPRIETNRSVTIPFAFGKCEETGRVENFLKAADAMKGLGYSDKLPGFPFDDTDIYKVIEGAAYTLSVHPDPKLDAYIDSLIVKIAAAQEKDGYLYTARTMNPAKPHDWSGAHRWEKEEDGSHELYNLGHLYEAAVAHYQATGKRNLLDIAIKTADLLVATFGPGKQKISPGHQITEMGLVKLYRVTGNQSYLDLAKFMLDTRGPGGKPYSQAHLKVVDQDEAVGHAVRATYMYSGIADVAAITGNQAYLNAIDKIWENVASRKLYITGGIGATSDGSEAFGKNYELPNMTAYNETCASIGNDYWNHRLFLLHGDAKYIDVMERTLYNGLISGVSLDGKTFFYPNPLESNGQHTRSPWFGCACCPGNVTRFMASVPGYVYAQHDDILFVNLYAQGKASVKLDSGPKVQLAQETHYPWDGNIKLIVTPDKAGRFTVNMRIPGWARNEAVPSDLYRFTDTVSDAVVLKVNGKPVPVQLQKGYAALTRQWKAGDVVELSLPMPVRRVIANPQVAADRDRVALQRGPIVYALEWPDNGGHVRNLVLPASSKLSASFRPDLLNGVEVITGSSEALSYDADGTVKRAPQQFTAIPYYAWANRGAGQMTVWVPTTEAAARPAPYPILSMKSKATSSKGDVWGLNDGDEPVSSAQSGGQFQWMPARGTSEWVEYSFPEASTVSETQVYWFEGGERGRFRVPASWRVLYRDGNEWKPVEAAGPFGVEKDRYNRVSFKPVKTTAIRLEATLQPNASAGIQEWKVK